MQATTNIPQFPLPPWISSPEHIRHRKQPQLFADP